MGIQKKDEKPKPIKGRSVNNKSGVREDEPGKVKKVYEEFYRDLLKVKEAETEEEKKVEEVIDRCVEAMEKKAKHSEIEEATKEEYEEMKEKLKKGKAPDCQGWSYELITNAGKELDKSIHITINKLLAHQVVPREWREMIIQPIDKVDGWK